MKTYIVKELSLIDSNDIKLAPIIFYVTHHSARDCFSQLSISKSNKLLKIRLFRKEMIGSKI